MIFFDIDDTLLDNHSAEFEAAKDFHRLYENIFPVSSYEFASSWRVITEKHVQRYISGELSFQGQRRARLKEIFSHKCTLSDEEADTIFQRYLACYENNWRLFGDVLSCFKHLEGQKLGIISNGDSSQQRQKLARTGIIDKFTVIAISGDIGVSKPDPQIFIEACRMGGVEPSDCWHIGDNLDADLKGSTSAGMKGIWLNRDGDNSIRAGTTIASLLDLKNSTI